MEVLGTQIVPLNYQDLLQNIGIVEMALKGAIIGVVASAPMGPVGILCVQRTLNKGRHAGLATGVGAALSDIIYAVVTGYGMSFVIDIIRDVRVAFWIKLAGSLLLFLFGLYTYRSNPAGRVKPVSRNKGTLFHHFLTGFLVTFSNPLIVFLFVGLFGQFTFILPGNPVPQVVGYVFIVAGALGWWFGLTWLVDKVRGRFDVRGIWRINRAIGLVVMVVSALMALYTLGVLSFISW